jgi:hypothetical protein
MNENYLTSAIKQFEYYKLLGEKTFDQLSDADLFFQYNDDTNSIATIVQHLHGNMLSRWTDFLTTDGEKDWRQRDAEFEPAISTKSALMVLWQQGWTCLFDALQTVKIVDLNTIVYIRNQGHTITDAINRQLAHYAYHVGQIVFLGKMLTKNDWQSLSVPKGKSKEYNSEKFAQPKQNQHFTDEILKDKEK